MAGHRFYISKIFLAISYLRVFLLLFIAVAISGCFMSSTLVSSIGARAKYGETKLTSFEKEVSIEIIDTSLIVNGWAMGHGLAIPYVTLMPAPGGESLEKIVLNLADIKWSNDKNYEKIGEVQCLLKGVQTKFEVRQVSIDTNSTRLSLESRYRYWYGYPAQSLLVVSLPVDVATDVVLIGAFIVVAPVYYGIGAIIDP